MTDKIKILAIDDEVEILNSINRVFRKQYDVHVFEFPDKALDAIKEHEFAVIISDMKMPAMDGATFLTEANKLSPNSVRILLTGYSDMESTIRAINEGHIYSFMSKPWNNDELKLLVENAVKYYQTKAQNSELTDQLQATNEKLSLMNLSLEKTVKERTVALRQSNAKLKQSVQRQRAMFHRLLDMISLIVDDRVGGENGHSKRVALHCKLIAEMIGLDRPIAMNIYIAGLAHNIGKVALADDIIKVARYSLSNEQKNKFLRHAVSGAEIVAKLPQMQPVAHIIKHQFENIDGTGVPNHLAADDIPLGSRIVRVVSDLDAMIQGELTGEKMTPDDAFQLMQSETATLYDGNVVKMYKALMAKLPKMKDQDVDYCIAVDRLETGMTTAKNVTNKTGGVLVTKDTELTPDLINKLKDYEKENKFHLSIYVY
jgi:response regulator RpfG family c-di-GMP phosphodiesterase